MKVYCSNCKYYLFIRFERGIIQECCHKDNIKIVHGFSNKFKEYINPVWQINEYNDCKNYKRTWYKFWVKEEL